MSRVQTYRTKNRKKSLKRVIKVLEEFGNLSERDLREKYQEVTGEIIYVFQNHCIKMCVREHKKLYLKKRIIETILKDKYGVGLYF